jgi:hypothetical protein
MDDKTIIFWLVNAVLIIISGIVCFRSFSNFGKTIYWMIFPNIISLFSKKLWKKDFENTFRFELFFLLSIILVGLNYLIFRFLVPTDI